MSYFLMISVKDASFLSYQRLRTLVCFGCQRRAWVIFELSTSEMSYFRFICCVKRRYWLMTSVKNAAFLGYQHLTTLVFFSCQRRTWVIFWLSASNITYLRVMKFGTDLFSSQLWAWSPWSSSPWGRRRSGLTTERAMSVFGANKWSHAHQDNSRDPRVLNAWASCWEMLPKLSPRTNLWELSK